jgi:protein-S-isoprenylcysteine O-methyltransferase Ste14
MSPSVNDSLPVQISDRTVGLLCLAILMALVVRTIIVYQATGRFPIRIKRSDSLDDFIQYILIVVLVSYSVNLVLMRLPSWLSATPGTSLTLLYEAAGPFTALESPIVRLAGIVIAGIGLAVGALAQHQMGTNWRVGIDRGSQTEFVQHGLFAVARHPIYLALVGIGVGVFLAMPSALTCAGLAVLVTTLGIQARLEEAYMSERHGEVYQHYLKKTPRWL